MKEPKVRYCYWIEGMEKPYGLPNGCEWQLEEGRDAWRTENSSPSDWSGDHKRRWPCRMDFHDALFIRACKNFNLNTVYRFKRIMAKRCALETKYVGMYNVTMHLWEIIQNYGLAPDMTKVVEEFMRPLYVEARSIDAHRALCSLDDYPDFGVGKDTILKSFVIAKGIIRHAEAIKFKDLSTRAWFKNKGVVK